MRKFLLVFSLIVIISGYLFYSYLPNILSDNLSKKLQVPVSLQSLTLWPHSIHAADLRVDNLPNSKFPKALTIEDISIQAPITTYLHDNIEIEEITLDTIELALEFDSASGTKGNWSLLMANFSKDSSPSSSHTQIKKIVLKNIQVHVFYKDTKSTKTLPLIAQITLTDIDTAEGVPSEQIMKTILGQMLQSVFIQENLKNMLDGILQQPKGTIDSLLAPFKKIFQ